MKIKSTAVHVHSGPCAIMILRQFYPPQDAYDIAMEYTCFPFDCDTASKQALQFIMMDKKIEMITPNELGLEPHGE